MAETRSNWGELVEGVSAKVFEIFDQTALAYEISGGEVVRMKDGDGAQMTHSGKTGSGYLEKYQEGSGIPVGTRYKLYQTTYIFDNYGKQLEITKNMIEDRLFSEFFDEFKDLTVGGKVTMNRAMFQIFNGGFVTTNPVNGFTVTRYGDAVPLCSTVHPRVDGGTAQSNADSAGSALDDDQLEVARLNIYHQLQDDGTPISIQGKLWLVVPMALDKTAQILTGSALRSDTANNDVNIYHGGAVNVLSTHWLDSANGGSDTQWFLVAPEVARLFFIKRQDLEPDRAIDFNTKNVKFSLDARWAVGHSHWLGAYGSKGDGAAYSS